MDSLSLAQVFLGFGGTTLYMVGTSFTTIGTVYAINKITSMAISVIQHLPMLLGYKSDSVTTESNAIVLTRENLLNGFGIFGRISGLIILGALIKMGGSRLSSEASIKFFNDILYSRRS
jgi:hypothetical protein